MMFFCDLLLVDGDAIKQVFVNCPTVLDVPQTVAWDYAGFAWGKVKITPTPNLWGNIQAWLQKVFAHKIYVSESSKLPIANWDQVNGTYTWVFGISFNF